MALRLGAGLARRARSDPRLMRWLLSGAAARERFGGEDAGAVDRLHRQMLVQSFGQLYVVDAVHEVVVGIAVDEADR